MELVPGNDDVRMSNPGVKLTYDDFVLFPDDGKRHELIDGEHFVTPSPNSQTPEGLGNLHLLIGTLARATSHRPDLFRAVRCRLLDVRRGRTGSALHVERARRAC